MISFVTAIKICRYYEDYGDRLKDYIENISWGCGLFDISYEIIVCEDICEKNVKLLGDIFSLNFLKENNTKLISIKQDYPNPIGYNMIEAYAKNAGLHESKGEYVCITNADILFNYDFFDYVKNKLQKNRFYRFLQYESKNIELTVDFTPLLIAEHNVKRAVNPFLNVKTANYRNLKNMNSIDAIVVAMANKSGDIMLMDKENWLKIKGFPENKYWVHSDYIVCRVVNNNRIPIEAVQEPVKIYTFQPKGIQPLVRNEQQPSDDTPPDVAEWKFAQSYNSSLTCN